MRIEAREHWTEKDGVRLFLFQKWCADAAPHRGTILFVHGSSMAGQATFDLQVPGHPGYSAMDFFAKAGFDTWSADMEGYGRSDKHRPINCGIENGAADVEAASRYILAQTGRPKLLLYGVSSGSLRAGCFAQRHPERVARLALDAFVWTGDGSPTLAERRKSVPQLAAANRRPIDRAFVHGVFARDRPEATDPAVVEAFADALLALDDSVPTGTYLEMCTKLPVVDPERITMPTLILRGEYDGIATVDDLIAFFARLPNPDKQLSMLPAVAHASFQTRNRQLVFDTLLGFFGRSEPAYRG